MRIKQLAIVLAVMASICRASFGDTLTFIAQQDTSGVFDYNWFSAMNWFTTNSSGVLVPAGRVPLTSDSAIITGFVDATGSGVRVASLVATNNAVINGGTFAVENLEMLSGSTFSNATVNILVTMTATGSNCSFISTTVSILGIATGHFIASTNGNPTLVLKEGSSLLVGGKVTLSDGFQLASSGLVQNRLFIGANGLLTFAGAGLISGVPTNHLQIDNSGTIHVQNGTVEFNPSVDWQCSGGSAEFNAANPSALILFEGPYQLPSGATCIFAGLGTNHLSAGGQLDGIAQVGGIDQLSQSFLLGNLETAASLTGAGSVHVLGGSTPGSVFNFENGTVSLPMINIDAGGQMLFSGAAGSSRQLSGCIVNNSGACNMISGGLGLAEGAAISNQVGAVFEIDADGAFTGAAFPGGIFNNAGTLRKASPGTTQFGASGWTQGPDFNNSGLVDIQSGQLNLLGGASSGVFQTETNAVLMFWGGTHVLNSGATFTGAGSVRLSKGISAPTWSLTGAMSVPELELGLNATVQGPGVSPTNLIQIASLRMTDDSVFNNANLAAQIFQMADNSSLVGTTVKVAGGLSVGGTNCALNATTLTIPAGASLNFSPQAPSSWAGLSLTQGSLLQAGGQITLTDGSRIGGSGLPQSKLALGPGGVLISSNSAVVQGGTNGNLIIDNSGIFRADTGVLHFQNGIDWATSAGLGEFRAVDPSSMIVFESQLQVQNGITNLFTGAGTNRFQVSAHIDGTAQVGGIDSSNHLGQAGNLNSAGSLSGTGSIHVLGGVTPSALFTWEAGELGLKTVNIDPGAGMLISGSSGATHQLSGCVINNFGLCRWVAAGPMIASAGAGFNNMAGGTLQLQTDVTVASTNNGALLLINNSGDFLKSGGAGSSTIAADFNNSGTLEIQSGRLAFGGTLLQTSGSTIITNGTVLGGALINLQGGTLTGQGKIAAPVVNNAVISPGTSAGILTLAPGEDYQQSTGGTLRLKLNGTSPGTEYQQFAVGGNATLDGGLQLVLANSFIPHAGDQFEILSCASLAGSFSSLDAPHPPGTVWVVRYLGTNVTVALANQVSLAEPSISGGQFHLSFNTTAGLSYVVEAADALNPPNWQILATRNGDGAVQTVTDSIIQTRHFYRVSIQ